MHSLIKFQMLPIQVKHNFGMKLKVFQIIIIEKEPTWMRQNRSAGNKKTMNPQSG